MQVLCCVLLSLTIFRSAHAAVVEYTNKSAWHNAAGSYSTITFMELPVNTLITTQYSHLGVTFTDGSDYVYANSGFLNDGVGLNGAFDETTLTFTQPMHTIAIDFPGRATLKLYYRGQLIYTSTDFGGSGTGHFAGLISDTPFDEVYMYDPTEGFFIDDLHFGPAIPAPGALALAAVAGAFMSRRRRRT